MRMGNFLQNTPKAMPNDFISPQEAQMRDYVGQTPTLVNKKGEAFVHTPIIGACTVCKLTGSVDLPTDMSFKTEDKLLDGRIAKVLCPKCRKVTEFRPLSPEELNEDQFFIMRRYYDIYKKEVVDGRPVPEHLKVFIEEYEKRLQSARTKKQLAGMPKAAAPEIPSGHVQTPGGIIIPE